MRKVTSRDGETIKYTHEESMSETTVKLSKSCKNSIENGRIVSEEVDNHAATIFISCASGCNLGCRICWLTTKGGYKYKPKNYQTITREVESVLKATPELKDKYIKLSFMGMGDALHLSNFDTITYSITEISRFIRNYSLGLDGIDIGTCVPASVTFENVNKLVFLCKLINKANWLTTVGEDFSPYRNYHSRSKLRVFISLHHTDDASRKVLMPNSAGLPTLIELAEYLRPYTDLIFHYTLLDSFNMSPFDISRLQDLFGGFGRFSYDELRLLKYNDCGNSDFVSPSEEKFIEFAEEISKFVDKLKVQTSVGSEIEAACGMFTQNIG